jgi:hypothetical protein
MRFRYSAALPRCAAARNVCTISAAQHAARCGWKIMAQRCGRHVRSLHTARCKASASVGRRTARCCANGVTVTAPKPSAAATHPQQRVCDERGLLIALVLGRVGVLRDDDGHDIVEHEECRKQYDRHIEGSLRRTTAQRTNRCHSCDVPHATNQATASGGYMCSPTTRGSRPWYVACGLACIAYWTLHCASLGLSLPRSGSEHGSFGLWLTPMRGNPGGRSRRTIANGDRSAVAMCRYIG